MVTHPQIYKSPTPIEIALGQIDAWRESPSLQLLAENANYWTELSEIVRHGKLVGPGIHDARIAAMCKAHGVRELWTADRDFSRISGLKTRNPLLKN